MTHAQRELADYCEYLPDGSRKPCYAPATLVLVRPTGQTMRFTCAAHREASAERIQGPYRVVVRSAWESSGAGYRGPHLGGGLEQPPS